MKTKNVIWLVLGLSVVFAQRGYAQREKVPLKGTEVAPIRDLLIESEDLRYFDEHLVFLSNPFLGGRLPGTPGMELAKDYMEHYFRLSGLEAPFNSVEVVDGKEVVKPFASFRQPFDLGGRAEITSSTFSFGGDSVLKKGVDYDVTGYSSEGSIEAPVVFVGYGLENEEAGFKTYGDDADLSGKIAMILRFEPMDEEGKSLWAEEGRQWSRVSGFRSKINAARERKAAGIILVNAPGANDPRADVLRVRGRAVDIPIFSMSSTAGDDFVKMADGRSLKDLRLLSDKEGVFIPLNATAKLECEIDRTSVKAENVGGLIRGKGNLSGEMIVVGAHLDHLGNGEFGSRRGSGQLHPGADDNASGSAGIMLMADKLIKMYAELPEGANARSVLFLGFSAEESGLNGSRHYVTEPLVPLDRHYCMINFDMVGRIINKRLSVSGGNSAEGFANWLKPYYEKSGLVIVESDSYAGSDHIPFHQNKIPILFGIIADFHDDYHTPDDVSWKINRVDAVRAMNLFLDIVYNLGLKSEPLIFKEAAQSQPEGQRAPGRGTMKVTFGVRPNYDEGSGGLLIETVTEGGSAERAGIKAGDLIVKWGGDEVSSIQDWMVLLSKQEPGDEVVMGVVRDGKKMELKATLDARDG